MKKKKKTKKRERERKEVHICANIGKGRRKEQAVKVGHPVYHGRRTVNKSNCVNAREMDASNRRVAFFLSFARCM